MSELKSIFFILTLSSKLKSILQILEDLQNISQLHISSYNLVVVLLFCMPYIIVTSVIKIYLLPTYFRPRFLRGPGCLTLCDL